jgi:hypothetical protein
VRAATAAVRLRFPVRGSHLGRERGTAPAFAHIQNATHARHPPPRARYNVDVVCEFIEKRIPVPVRDFVSPPQMIIIR